MKTEDLSVRGYLRTETKRWGEGKGGISRISS